MAWQKSFVESIRREKFFIGTKNKNPLAPELHEAITQLSMELYQNDIHFMKEIIQNAEDNRYAESVSPSLEFLLTKEDVAKVGASVTLLVLNNEEGLTTSDVHALCRVAFSTKKGKRNEGYIGCKGIGFKSVFMVCETPIIISKGYRLRFRDEACEEAGVGYIVPEWIESPTDGAIMAACGRDELPNTVIILPIRDGKADQVRKQLKELSPEIILFLSRLRELKIVDNTRSKDAFNSGELLKITRSDRLYGISSDVCKFFQVNLCVESSGKDAEKYSYFVFQQSFPVTHPVQDRQEIHEWQLTLAFPDQQGRPPSNNVGDIFSFLPTELKTGFPFIVNADFILTSSRESIRFDSTWNVGILDCIPAAFRIAFQIMLRKRDPLLADGIILSSHLVFDSKDAYRYLPCHNVENAYKHSPIDSDEHRRVRQKLHIPPNQAGNIHQLEKVRGDIFHAVGNDSVVLLSRTVGYGPKPGSAYFKKPTFCLQVKSSFLAILESAAESDHPAPSVVTKLSSSATLAIVDGYVQQNYAAGLIALGVPQMSVAQYNSFLTDSEWLLKLPEELYLKVLTFFAFEMKILDESTVRSSSLLNFLDPRTVSSYSTSKRTFRLVKVRDGEGGVELVTFDEVSNGTELWYTSSADGADWISQWVMQFSPWNSAKVMTTETSEALRKAGNSEELVRWFRKHGSLTELSIQSYSQKVIERLIADSKDSSIISRDGHKHSILLVQFLYGAIKENLLPWQETVQRLQALGHVYVVDQRSRLTRNASLKTRMEGGLLLPPTVSKWPLLLDLSQGSFPMKRLIVLSNMYLDPQCSLVATTVSTSPGPVSMLEFIKESFNAVDIQSIKIPTNVPLPFRSPMTIEKSILLLEWLKSWLPGRRKTRKELDNDVFLRSLKTLSCMKTVHHGWQCPTSVFFELEESDFCGDLTSQDLPFLDLAAYEDVDFTDEDVLFVLEELEMVRDTKKKCAAVAGYLSRQSAGALDKEVVERFYGYLHESEWREETHLLKIWIPATKKSKVPFWRASEECMIRDEDNLFAENSDLTVLDKVYDESLLPFFSEALRVPENAPAELYCDLWLKCCKNQNVLTLDDGTPKPLCLTGVKVHSIWKNMLENWSEVRKEVWDSFVSQAWVPVGPKSTRSSQLISEIVCVVPPTQVFIADDLSMFKLFSKPASEKLDFVWQLPGISNTELKSLTDLYSAMGVRKLSKFVRSELSFPPQVWNKQVPRGQGLICEGLLRTVLAYLSHHEHQHGLSRSERQKILSPLMFADEVVVSEPFKKSFTLQTETFSSTGTHKKNTLAHYDRVKGKLYHLSKDHALLQTELTKRDFNSQLARTLANGILFEHPELAPGLIRLLKLLCDSGFEMDSVEYELQEQNLVINPEDEKMLNLLMENLATRHETDSGGHEFMISESNYEYSGTRSNCSRALQFCGSQSSLSQPLDGPSNYLLETQDSGSYGKSLSKQKFLSN